MQQICDFLLAERLDRPEVLYGPYHHKRLQLRDAVILLWSR